MKFKLESLNRNSCFYSDCKTMKTKCILFDADGVIIDSENFGVAYQKDFGMPKEKMLPFIK